jgi:hypothetical protein
LAKSEVRLWCRVLREPARDPKHWHGSQQAMAKLWRQYRRVAARPLWRRSP